MNATALVTGASGGIGLALTQLLAKDQYNLVMVARSEDKLNELKKTLSKEYDIEVFRW